MGFYLFWLKYKFSRSFSLSRERDREKGPLYCLYTVCIDIRVERRVSCTPYAR